VSSQPIRPAAAEPGTPPPAEAVQERNPWLILIVLCGAIFMLLLDTTIVNVAQQKIKEGLNADLPQIQWVLDSYILTYAVLLLSFGRMGDVFGRKKLFVLGMAIFTAASALCGASYWLGQLVGVSGVNALIFARVLQGIGGAFMMPQTLSLIAVAFPPHKRGAAMGIWGSVVALGAIIGPIAGGLIVTNYAWEWVFLINVPVGIVAILATRAIVPESTDPLASKRLDWGGLLLSGFGIFAVVYALIEGNKLGWTSPLILGLLAAGVVLLALFIRWERRAPDPMMKLELFRLRNFWVGNVIATTVSFGMLGIFFPMTLFLQAALGYSPIRAGLTMMPLSIMIGIVAPVAGRLTDRFGARWILVTGLTLMTGGIVFITDRITPATTWQSLLPALVITGIGMGMTFSPMTAAAMAEVPPRIAGSASGILNTMRNVGQVLGIAVLGSVLQGRLALHAGDHLNGLELDPTVQARLVDLLRNIDFAAIPTAVPVDRQSLLPQLYAAGQLAFVEGLHDTFYVGALACLLAAGTAVLIRNPVRRPAFAATPRPEPVERATAAD
jgi:EmrB/QacA subfamily drug resistance transporter